ncbi:hypothetical protein GQ600_10167 [Phytophthora cactorum]|nr:hypothetical protein GQ600_10167 [Phytophthora cactorum]
MKGKWSKNVFPPLTLSTEQESQFRHLARGLVRETLAHFNTFDRLTKDQRDLTKHKRWKTVKTRDNLTVFKERDPPKIITGTSFDTPEHQRLAEDEWQMPKLLVGIGSIVGSLDDVISLVDGAVLAQIDEPTPEEPYRFLGVKWFVKGPPATLRGFVQPRDLVFVESTGILTRSNGDCIGYQLLHSVDLDGYGALPGRSLTRGRISSCTIFRETQDGKRVDVYVRGYVEQHGKLLDSMALKAASTGFLSSWNAVECGHVKKLMWFVKNPHLVAWREKPLLVPGDLTLGPRYAHTAAPASMVLKVSSVGLCSLCQVPMCSKCRVTKKLAYATCELKLERRESIICRSCVAKVRLQPVRRIAQQEIRDDRYRWQPTNNQQQPVAAQTTNPPSSGSIRSHVRVELNGMTVRTPRPPGLLQLSWTAIGSSSSNSNSSLKLRPRILGSASDQALLVRRHKKSEHNSAESRPVLFGESTALSDCQLGALSQCSTAGDSPINPLAYSWASSAQESDHRARVEEADEDDWAKTPEFTENQQERRQLWHQMTELRLAVENTYQIAKHTTDSCCGPRFSPLGKASVNGGFKDGLPSPKTEVAHAAKEQTRDSIPERVSTSGNVMTADAAPNKIGVERSSTCLNENLRFQTSKCRRPHHSVQRALSNAELPGVYEPPNCVPSRTSRASIADRVSMAFRGGNEWTEPKLLVATGWIEGALDDVMYGVSSPDAQSMLMKATVVKNTLVNGAVLACIDAPCDADPFRFLGIKWFVKGPPTGLQGIVRPRDLVFIEATGVTTRPNGERIGYQLLHSVDLPQYRDLTPQSNGSDARSHLELLHLQGNTSGTWKQTLQGASIMTLPTEEEYSLSVLSPTADLPIDSFRGVEPAKEPYPDIPEPSEELQVEKKKKEKVMLSDRERREQIWSQMVELRMLAESIYQLTLETTESLNATPQRTTHGA